MFSASARAGFTRSVWALSRRSSPSTSCSGTCRGATPAQTRSAPGASRPPAVKTLLLDDMQTLDLGVQKQLLQVLDGGVYSAVGSDRKLTVACRIILAMTEDPDALMKKGVLLKDLRYRFGACAIRIPALRERRAEIPMLAKRALARCPEETKVDGPTGFSEAALALLCAGEWEGNVRELGAVVEYAYLIGRAAGSEEIRAEHLPQGLCPAVRYQRRGDPEANASPSNGRSS